MVSGFCTFVALLGYLITSVYSADPINIGNLVSWNFNGLSSEDITILNSKQMKIEDLHFTDQGPAVWFMAGTESENEYSKEFSAIQGTIIPDEDGSCSRLKGYKGDDVVITLPRKLTWSDFKYLSVFCVRFGHNFGYVTIPQKKVEAAFGNVTADSGIPVPQYCPQDVEGRPGDDEDGDDDI